MGFLDKFEKGIGGAVNGVFSKFGSKDLQPVDLSSALEREIDSQAMAVRGDRTVAPTSTGSSFPHQTLTTSNSGVLKHSPMSLQTTSPSMPKASTTHS